MSPSIGNTLDFARAKQPRKAHGLYTEGGRRIDWDGRIVLDRKTGRPRLDPVVRLDPGERVFAWYNDELVAEFKGGQQHGEKSIILPPGVGA